MEEMPEGLCDGGQKAEPVDNVAEFVKGHFPDLHIEDWVLDVLRKVHFGTLEKMAVHASTRLGPSGWSHHMSSLG